jgi:PKD repeat protein
MRKRSQIEKGLVFGVIVLVLGTSLNALTVLTEANVGGPDYFGYRYIDSNEPTGPVYNWIDITATGTSPSWLNNSDDHFVDGIPIGFLFTFYGLNYTQLSITNNGILGFNGGASQAHNAPIGSSVIDNFILPYWDDLVTWGTPPTGIFYETLGTAPDQMFVVEWLNNEHYHNSPSGITFEVILFEGSNDIQFQYQDVTFDDGINDYGASATVGVEGPTGQGLQYSCNQSMSIVPNLAILITSADLPPIAAFTYSPSQPTDLEAVFFVDASFDYDGYITAWSWDFGDGSYSQLQNPTHLYSDEGTYTVSLTVTDNDGVNTTSTLVVMVSNVAPTADFIFTPEHPTILDIIQFTDLSSDPDGSIANWIWDFGDGTFSSLQHPTHQYTQKTTYIVELLVTDDDGAFDSLSTSVTISNIPPLANFTYTPAHPTNTTDISFFDTSTDGDGSIMGWWWDFNDGTYSSQQNPVHRYYTDGDYQVTLTVTDNDGATNTTQELVVVYTPAQNQPPYEPSNPCPPDGATNVSLNGSLSWTGGDPDVNDTVTYDVYFGMTSPPSKVMANQSGTNYDLPTLSYDTRYYWKIVAWDNHGALTLGPIWSFNTISAPNTPPYIPGDPTPTNGSSNVSVFTDLSWTGGDPDAGDTVTYDVYFGTTSPPGKIVNNQTNTSYDTGTMACETTYYWRIVSWDDHNASTAGPLWCFTTEAQSDVTPPTVAITSPQKNYLYINIKDLFIFSFRFFTTVVIGKIDVTVQATDNQSGVAKVEFYIDGVLKATDTTFPYNWTWSEQMPLFPYVVKVVAYDYAGNQKSDEMSVWKFL